MRLRRFRSVISMRISSNSGGLSGGAACPPVVLAGGAGAAFSFLEGKIWSASLVCDSDCDSGMDCGLDEGGSGIALLPAEFWHSLRRPCPSSASPWVGGGVGWSSALVSDALDTTFEGHDGPYLPLRDFLPLRDVLSIPLLPAWRNGVPSSAQGAVVSTTGAGLELALLAAQRPGALWTSPRRHAEHAEHASLRMIYCSVPLPTPGPSSAPYWGLYISGSRVVIACVRGLTGRCWRRRRRKST